MVLVIILSIERSRFGLFESYMSCAWWGGPGASKMLAKEIQRDKLEPYPKKTPSYNCS